MFLNLSRILRRHKLIIMVLIVHREAILALRDRKAWRGQTHCGIAEHWLLPRCFSICHCWHFRNIRGEVLLRLEPASRCLVLPRVVCTCRHGLSWHRTGLLPGLRSCLRLSGRLGLPFLCLFLLSLGRLRSLRDSLWIVLGKRMQLKLGPPLRCLWDIRV